MQPKLSICIPTYNRASYLDECLNSIISQVNDNIEIVISDNASTDDTKEIISKYQKIFPNIIYHRWLKNMGFDKNILKVVEIATGDYCWLMGSDDALGQNAIKKIARELESKCDVYLCNRTECNINLNPQREKLWLSQTTKDQIFNFSNKIQLLDYLNKSRSLGALFSFISSIIVKKEVWSQVNYNKELSAKGYAHVFMLLSLMNSGIKLKYISDPRIILCRLGNDEFNKNDLLGRFLFDIDGYEKMAKSFPGDIYKNILRILTCEYKLPRIAKIRNSITDPKTWHKTKERLIKIGFKKRNLKISEILGSSSILILSCLTFKRYLDKFKHYIYLFKTK